MSLKTSKEKKVTFHLFAFVCFLCAQKDSIFMCIKTSKKKEITCLKFCLLKFFTFDAFCANKNI